MLISFILNPILERPKLSGHVRNNRCYTCHLEPLTLLAKRALGANRPTLRRLSGVLALRTFTTRTFLCVSAERQQKWELFL